MTFNLLMEYKNCANYSLKNILRFVSTISTLNQTILWSNDRKSFTSVRLHGIIWLIACQ